MRQLTETEVGLFRAFNARDVDTDARAAALGRYMGSAEEGVAMIQEIVRTLASGGRVDFPGGTLYPSGNVLVSPERACPSCGER